MRWRQDYYLFVIGAIAFTAATVGYQHRRVTVLATPPTSPAWASPTPRC
jgi:hypothetical protein